MNKVFILLPILLLLVVPTISAEKYTFDLANGDDIIMILGATLNDDKIKDKDKKYKISNFTIEKIKKDKKDKTNDKTNDEYLVTNDNKKDKKYKLKYTDDQCCIV